MPIFRFLSLGNETQKLVFETQKRLVFLGLKHFVFTKVFLGLTGSHAKDQKHHRVPNLTCPFLV